MRAEFRGHNTKSLLLITLKHHDFGNGVFVESMKKQLAIVCQTTVIISYSRDTTLKARWSHQSALAMA